MTEGSENIPKLAQHDDQLEPDVAVGRVAARRVAVVVLGMHRSGTSAITRMLSLLGCSLPKTLIAANPTNPEGHWESDPIAQLNNRIFAQAGTQWDDWLPVNPRLAETLVWPQLVAQGRDVLRQEFADAPLFVLKDPRICKLSGFWLEVLAAEGVEAAFVLPLRNPIEVARSLSVRDGTDEYRGLLVWLRHVLAAEAASRGRPRVFTDFAALLDNWGELSAHLSAGLGLVWPRVSALSGSEISQFLTPDLRHYVSKSADLTSNSSISPWVRRTYEVLLGWARHGERPADYDILDQISRAFDDAGTAFAQPMLNAGFAFQRAAQVDAERDAVTQERDAVYKRLGEAEAGFAQVSAELDARTVERDGLAGENTAIAEQRDTFAQRLDEVETGLAQVCADRDARTAERDELAGERATLTADRDRVAWLLGEAKAELARGGVEHDELIAERNILAGESTTLTEERDRVAWRLGEVEGELARTADEREAIAAERDLLAIERARLGEERNNLTWRLGEVEAELRVAQVKVDSHDDSMAGFLDDLAIARTGADTLNHRLAVAESTLRQREEEIAQLGQLSAELESARLVIAKHGAASSQQEREQRELAAARQTVEHRALQAEAERDAQNNQLIDRFNELAELTRMLREKNGHIAQLKTELTDTQFRLDNGFVEIAQLTQMYRNYERQAVVQGANVAWLRRVHAVFGRFPRWWALMPNRWQREREWRRLRNHGVFDADAYLAKYPDVEQKGMEPLRHYILHGMAEGRSI